MTHSTHDPQKCRWMFEKLSEYIDKELDEVTYENIRRHAWECIPCRICLGTMKRTIELCKNMESESVPDLFSARLKEMIQSLS